MEVHKSLIAYDARVQTKPSWTKAYIRFLGSSDENMLLKIAPLALAGILPLDIISNIIPVVGELNDVGFIIALVVVVVRTINRVRKYRVLE